MADKFQPKPMSGALFPNDKDGGNPNWPDFRGDALIDGKAYWVSAWEKEGKNGHFLSLAFKPKEQKDTRTQSYENRPQEQPKRYEAHPRRFEAKEEVPQPPSDDEVPF